MKNIAVVFVALTGLSASYNPVVPVVFVPTLSGEDVIVREGDIDKITPLGWAMMLDRDFGTLQRQRTLALYVKACEQNPDLDAKVQRHLEIKYTIDARRKALKVERSARMGRHRI